MRISTAKRAGKGSKRLDLGPLRAATRDGRVWCQLGVVISPDGGDYWEIATDDSGNKMVMVEVQTMPEGLDLTCRLATKPCWYIPDVGSIVVVAVPSGEVDHIPAIVGILDGGAADTDIAASRTLLATSVDLVLKAPTVKLGGVSAAQAVVQGNTYQTALNTFLTKFAAAIATMVPGVTALCSDGGILLTALGTTDIPALAAASYLSTKVKTE